MDLELRLSLGEVTELLHQLLPLRIHLTSTDEDRRWVELEQPTEISLVPERGVRAVCSGRVRYELAGMAVPLTIRRLQVLLSPRITELAPARQRLDFELQIEEGDLENVPGLVDRALVAKINAMLTPETTGMVFGFSDALKRALHVPERLEPLESLLLGAPGAEVSITTTALLVRLHLTARLERSRARPSDD